MNTKTNDNVRMLATTALFASLIAVVTTFVRIPASHGGYAHCGDSIIYLAACILPPQFSMTAAAIGGFMADILAGAPQWAIPTAIIKVFNVLPFIVCRYFLKKYHKDDKILHPANIAMLIPSSIVTVVGYFIASGLMYGFEVSLISAFISGWIQPLTSAVVFFFVASGLDAVKFKSKIYPRLMTSRVRKTGKA